MKLHKRGAALPFPSFLTSTYLVLKKIRDRGAARLDKLEIRASDMQSYNIRHVYVDRIQESILFREVSRYFFRGHHLYDENFVPIKPIQYHGRGAFRLKPSTDPNHPPYPTTINGGVHDSNHFLSETQEGVYTLWWWSTGASDEQRARDTTADAASLRRAGIGGGHSCYGC